jgi:phytol kinase
LIKFTVVLLYLFSVFLISIVFKNFNENSREIVRKIIHIGIGPLIPIAQFLKIDQNSALFFTGIISFLVLINYKYKIFPSIEDVERKSYGTLFYCISLFILIFLFWDKDPYSLITGFFIMTFGDGLAGLIGKTFNSKSWIFFKQKKSFFGTITMLLTSLIVVSTLGYAQQKSFNLNYFTIAFIATLLEQFSVLGIDNFIVPISSALCFNFFITNL